MGDRVHGTGLFADISGFTPLMEALARELGLQRPVATNNSATVTADVSQPTSAPAVVNVVGPSSVSAGSVYVATAISDGNLRMRPPGATTCGDSGDRPPDPQSSPVSDAQRLTSLHDLRALGACAAIRANCDSPDIRATWASFSHVRSVVRPQSWARSAVLTGRAPRISPTIDRSQREPVGRVACMSPDGSALS